MGVVQAIKLMRSSIPGQIPALPMAQVAVNLTDKILFVGVDGTTDNVIKFVDMSGVASMISTAAYVHPSDGGGSIETALSGANVISKIIVNASGHVTGTDTRELVPSDIGAAPINHTMYIGTTGLALNRGTGAVALEGITSIDGSAAKLTTPRALTIGSTAKNFDGSAAVSWSLEDINTHLNTIAGLSTEGLLKRTSTTWVIDTTAYLPAAGGTISGNLTVNGDLVITGETVTANVETMTVEDPIITLGGTTAPTVNDGLDRGVEFRWHNGTVAKVGFFGFDRGSQKFTYIPDATNVGEVFSGAVGTILANFEGSLTGNASTATKVNNAVTFNNSGSGVASGTSFDGSTARTISYNTIGAAALAGSAGQDFNTKDLSVAGNLGVSGTTTLAGGVGITSGALTMSGKTGMLTPYVDFRYGTSGTYSSRIIEDAIKELSIYGGASADGKIKLKSDTYVEKALYIGGASGAKIVFVAASGETPAYLKLQNYDGGVMHFVTTGGQTMYSAGVPSEGGGGGATVILNGATNDNPAFYAPTSSGSPGQYLISGGEDVAPSWITMPTATSLVAGIMKLGASGGAATYEHGHTFASLSPKPNTLAGYGITDAVHSSHLTGGSAHGVATTGANGFMSSGDKTNLDLLYTNRLIYDAGDKADLAAALTSIPSTFYKEGLLLKYADANEQHIYMYISTEAMSGTTKIQQGNWLRISKPDVDGGTY